MGVAREVVTQNREQIIAAAERLFRAKGADAVGLNELMAAAGLTRGGFYNHFASKDALVEAVIARAMANGWSSLDAAITDAEANGRDAVLEQMTYYLSPRHRDDIDHGCSNAGFAGEAPRLSGPGQQRYTDGFARNLDRFTAAFEARPGLDRATARAAAVAVFSQMVGALLLSRAVRDSDPALAAELLDRSREDLARRLTPQT
ncbi:TetR/AcrR family transcriptional regulator [Actinoplanes sp. L3-i22]|uniref:TetR/AcrR family transcriptional regulator n=1 Tax=Actinoplanes sp. L3-i22 TaxID=2836373 RepID=UPI001C75C58B|nr:TetR/AcrR family transcriptional regulator [Actinoplanes sp. L3-i22]BCY11811.1 TetR family transcriptional regulator [Actinoplanes sp. L3-i22]